MLEKFTPILVDKDTEPEAVKEFGVGGIPHVIFADFKGKKLGDVLGAVGIGKFRSTAEGAAKKAGKPKPSKDYKTVLKALESLEKGAKKGKGKAVLSAAATIEKIGRPEAAVKRAREARAKVLADGKKQLEEAVKLKDAKKLEGAKKILRKLSQDLKGTDIGKQAAKLLKEVTAALKAAK